MKVLLVEPGKVPSTTTLDGSLKSMQKAVGGPIQAVYPFEDQVALICNEEGKLLGLPLNRALFNLETGECYDVVTGTFFLCGAPPDSERFESLNEEQLVRYADYFCQPEMFMKMGKQLCVLPLETADD